MVTFSDLIMLLLTFFVLLLSMSSMDTKKLKEIFMRLHESVALLGFSGARGIDDLANFITRFDQSEASITIDRKRLKDLFMPTRESERKVDEIIKDFQELVEIFDDERGVVLSFQETVFFDAGKATIKKGSFRVLDTIAAAIESCPNDILVMGHTDNIPLRSGIYRSNWELSAQRGLSVLEYFLKGKGLTPSRFFAGGCGASRPLYPNDTPHHRDSNRRVEIIFKHVEGA
jgi:chemotaxis protein MotB